MKHAILIVILSLFAMPAAWAQEEAPKSSASAAVDAAAALLEPALYSCGVASTADFYEIAKDVEMGVLAFDLKASALQKMTCGWSSYAGCQLDCVEHYDTFPNAQEICDDFVCGTCDGAPGDLATASSSQRYANCEDWCYELSPEGIAPCMGVCKNASGIPGYYPPSEDGGSDTHTVPYP